MSQRHCLLPLCCILFVTGAQEDNSTGEKIGLSGNLRENKGRQELDKNLQEEQLGEQVMDVSGRQMWEEKMLWEGWEWRRRAKKERLEAKKIERCLLQGLRITISSPKAAL